jgi:probable phosphoglycerate mutase
MAKQLYIFRHGQTDYNKSGIVQGRGVDAPLNEEGLRQAREKFEQHRHTLFDHIYVSALQRTQQTAQAFIDLGYSWSRHDQLDEIDWGIHEGKKANPQSRQEYLGIVMGWADGRLDGKMPGGESPLDVQKRVVEFFDEIIHDHHDRALIVSHGRTMRIMLCTLLGWDLRRMQEFEHMNLSLYVLDRMEDLFILNRKEDGFPAFYHKK